MLHHPNCVEMR
jgi:glycogen synthase kinase 3 beta